MSEVSSNDVDLKALNSVVLESGFPSKLLPLPLLFVEFAGVASRFVGKVRLNIRLLRKKSFDLAKYPAITEMKEALSIVLALWAELDFRVLSNPLWPSATKAMAAFREELGVTFREWIDSDGVTEQQTEYLTTTSTAVHNLECSVKLLWAAVAETPSTTISADELHNAISAVSLTKLDGRAHKWWNAALQATSVQVEPKQLQHDEHRVNPRKHRTEPLIPREYRTEVMTLREAARRMGFGDAKHSVKKLRTAIKVGAIPHEELGRQKHVFDLRKFRDDDRGDRKVGTTRGR